MSLICALLVSSPGVGSSGARMHPIRLHAEPRSRAVAIIDTAIARMGGSAALRAIHTVRYDLTTQWLGTSFDKRPFQDGPGYELSTDLRDYTTNTWRNTRHFFSGGAWIEMTDLVLDTVAARRGGPQAVGVATPAGVVDGWAPLNIA